ncbi:MAG: TIR domain-containing protein [Candidatus Methylumidiphilus sp.]
MTTFSWLHLTDFHFGLKGQDCLWPNLRQPFLDDLAELHELTGPWQAVLFTGDLVQQGKSEEFRAMQKDVLDRLWQRLDELGSGDAVLLAVPGNHDLFRPNPKEDNPAVDALLDEDGFQRISPKFWDNPVGTYRRVITDAFAAYSEWWNGAPHRAKNLTTGILPSDFACTLECGDLSVGIIGLNTAFLQLQGGDYQGKLVWDVRQLNAVCNGAADDWLKRHTVCLLLTHQGPDWLTLEARKRGESEIAPAGRFAVHLFGHRHETEMVTVQKRRLGYTVGWIEFNENNAHLRLWPRIATNATGPWRFIPDYAYGHLQADEGTAPESIPYRQTKATPAAIASGAKRKPAANPITPLAPGSTQPSRRPFLDGVFQRQGWTITTPNDLSAPANNQVASGAQLVYVSYAWGGDSDALVDEFDRSLPKHFKLIRDKNAMRPGDWISTFMAEIGRAELVLVVLSEKYLHSVYCMSELLLLFKRSLGDRGNLMQRIVPLVVGELHCARARDRDAYVTYWEQEYAELDALLKKRGIDSVGEADRRELLAIHAFKQQVSDLLAWIDDTLMPQGVEVQTKGIEAAIELLLQRASILRNNPESR